MMKEQHKAMFIALRDGQFDAIVEDGQAAKDAAATDKASAQARGREGRGASGSGSPRHRRRAAQPQPRSPLPCRSPLERTDDIEMVPQTTRMPEMTLDIEPLERAAASGSASRQLSDLPPPPANLFRDKSVTGGAYRTSTPPPADTTGKRASGPPPKKPVSAPAEEDPVGPAAGTSAPSERRYAAARPAAIFGQARPQQGNSIFGEDLISDKSLDEVILSYLAEDLEPPPEKKK